MKYLKDNEVNTTQSIIKRIHVESKTYNYTDILCKTLNNFTWGALQYQYQQETPLLLMIINFIILFEIFFCTITTFITHMNQHLFKVTWNTSYNFSTLSSGKFYYWRNETIPYNFIYILVLKLVLKLYSV